MSKIRPLLFVNLMPILVACLAASCVILSGCDQPLQTNATGLSVANVLRSQDRAGFATANRARSFSFPEDHGEHAGFKNEWWYFTGNLVTPQQRHFGFQFTLFRRAISPHTRTGDSRWLTNQVYLAHLAVTDTRNKRFYSDERFARGGAMELAGVKNAPFRAWLENWRVDARAERCGGCFEVDVSAASNDFGLELSLTNTKPAVLHGEAGLSRKSATPGNASYYYSFPRLKVKGQITLDATTFSASGEGWFDHEWSTSTLEPDQVGWDWFSIQLADNTELMLFQLRHTRDKTKNFLYGTAIDHNGIGNPLSPQDFTVRPKATWRSPATGVVYPVEWSVRIPSMRLDLALKAVVRAQEMNHSFRYWEGAVGVTGRRGTEEIRGKGYLELTGYPATTNK